MTRKQLTITVCAAIVAIAAIVLLTYRKPMSKVVKDSLSFSIAQSKLMYSNVADKDSLCINQTKDGKLVTCSPAAWVSGFFPGTLWYLYDYSSDAELKSAAEDMTQRLASEQYDRSSHDVGFIINCSYGNGYRLTGNENYRDVIINAATSLSSRFSPTVGCIRSWSPSPKRGWDFVVIIDNMMNLELLAEASKLSGQSKYVDIAKTHANTTLLNHFRDDFSTWHVINYDEQTGKVIGKQTKQGYSDDSSWARGQAWGLYGYTMMYRETGDQEYLDQAINIGKYIMDNPALPKDKVPYWDFSVKVEKDTPRDVSAAAIMASAYIELAGYVKDKALSKKFMKLSVQILRSLSKKPYLAKLGDNADFILQHSTVNKPSGNFDTPVVYADYYYIEALTRYAKLHK